MKQRTHIICHMVSSVDGKTDGAALSSLMADGEYEATGAKLKGDAWICGRTTMQQHFAQKKPFVSASKKPAGPRPVLVARRAKSYAISVGHPLRAIHHERHIKGKQSQNFLQTRIRPHGREAATGAD